MWIECDQEIPPGFVFAFVDYQCPRVWCVPIGFGWIARALHWKPWRLMWSLGLWTCEPGMLACCGHWISPFCEQARFQRRVARNR
jgi:hypothetical protein